MGMVYIDPDLYLNFSVCIYTANQPFMSADLRWILVCPSPQRLVLSLFLRLRRSLPCEVFLCVVDVVAFDNYMFHRLLIDAASGTAFVGFWVHLMCPGGQHVGPGQG